MKKREILRRIDKCVENFALAAATGDEKKSERLLKESIGEMKALSDEARRKLGKSQAEDTMRHGHALREVLADISGEERPADERGLMERMGIDAVDRDALREAGV